MPEASVTFIAALVTAAAAAGGCWLARGTTAVPAAAWGLLATGAIAAEAAARSVGWLAEPAALASARLVVAAVAVCPAASLLGAKRPQHGVWQFIVATLAGVLMLPAVSATLVRPGSMPDVHVIERVLLGVLVAVGWLNFLATRHGLAATAVAGGQAAMLWPVLVGFDGPGSGPGWLDKAGSLAVAAGAVLAFGQSLWWPAAARRGSATVAAAIDPAFLAVRETLGAAWTLRIAERFNSVASAKGWPCRLEFAGLSVEGGSGQGPWQRDAVRCCRSILRRFVSVEWLERRGGMRLTGCPGGGAVGVEAASPPDVGPR